MSLHGMLSMKRLKEVKMNSTKIPTGIKFQTLSVKRSKLLGLQILMHYSSTMIIILRQVSDGNNIKLTKFSKLWKKIKIVVLMELGSKVTLKVTTLMK